MSHPIIPPEPRAAAALTIIHLADIHIRDTARDRFALALTRLGEFLRTNRAAAPPDNALMTIVVGDVFHYKTRLSAENINDCYALLDTIAEHSRAIAIIPGNHDANLGNDGRCDLLTPILSNCRELRGGKCELFYWARSGWTEVVLGRAQFYVFSPLSRAGAPSVLDVAAARAEGSRPLRIALVHDFIHGVNVADGSGMTSEVRSEWLDQFDATMCGHFHDYAARLHPASGNPIVYCGALTQLTIGESFDKGFVIWDARVGTAGAWELAHRFIPIEIPGALVKYVVSADSSGRVRVESNCTTKGRHITPDAERCVVELRAGVKKDAPAIAALVDGIGKINPRANVKIVVPAEHVAGAVSREVALSTTGRKQEELIAEKLRAANSRIDDGTIASVIALHVRTMASIRASGEGNTPRASGDSAPPPRAIASVATKWTLAYLEWSDLFCYGRDNYINFASVAGIAGLIAPNRCGKSSILDILVLALFNRTLRGSACSIIRRGQRDASLRCVWTTRADASVPREDVHELTRAWNYCGKTRIQYLVNDRNMTDLDLRQTYLAIERSVGNLDDFLAAVLIPQHSDISFIDATDAQRRATISRILGLDLLDEALSIVKTSEREINARVRAQSEVVERITRRIAEIYAHACPQQASGAAPDHAEMRAAMMKRIEDANKYVADLLARLRELEAIPAVARPSKTRDDYAREIAAARGRLASLEEERAREETRMNEGRRQLRELMSAVPALFPSATPTISPISVEQLIDRERERLTRLEEQIDQSALAFARVKGGIKPSEIPSRLAREVKRCEYLGEMRAATEAIAARSAPSRDTPKIIADARMREFASAFGGAPPSTIDETRAARAVAVAKRSEIEARRGDDSLPRECRCARIEKLYPARNRAERVVRVDTIRRAMFAASVELPRDTPANAGACIDRIRAIVGTVAVKRQQLILAYPDALPGRASGGARGDPRASDGNTPRASDGNTPRASDGNTRACASDEIPLDALMEIAHCAIGAVRAGIAPIARIVSRGAFDDAQFCLEHHDEIETRAAIAAEMARADGEIARLDEWESHIIASERAAVLNALRAKLETARAGFTALAGDTRVPRTADEIRDQLHKSEQAVALLRSMNEQRAKIVAAQALDEEITHLKSRVDSCFAIQRATIAIDKCEGAHARARDNAAAARTQVADLEARASAVVAEWTAYEESAARAREITRLRDQYARDHMAKVSLIAESEELVRAQRELSEVSAVLAIAHRESHIHQLYAMALDAKTGIQRDLMANSIHLIEEETNLMLASTAQLRISIKLGAASVSSSAGGVKGAATVTGAVKAIAITVRDLARGDVEHAAELCSGFQRFVLSVALRRAFLRCAVRPMPHFMIIDEGFGCLDEANMTRMSEYLPELARELRFIMIVSHIDSLNTIITMPMPIDFSARGDAGGAIVSAMRFGARRCAALVGGGDGAARAGVIPVSTKAARAKKVALAYDAAMVDKRADGTLFCKLCGCDFKLWARHIVTKKHARKCASALVTK
jgi:DNA repair exonuclease SbcCD ATPase subunit